MDRLADKATSSGVQYSGAIGEKETLLVLANYAIISSAEYRREIGYA